MPHRGRLNLLTGLLDFPPTALFHKVTDLLYKLRTHCISYMLGMILSRDVLYWVMVESIITSIGASFLLSLLQLQGNPEFAAGEPSTGDVISHLSESTNVIITV